MARGGGFLSRIGRAIRNIVAPRREREQPPEQPPDFRAVWRVEDPARGSYKKHLALFHALIDPVESDPDEQLALWESYVKYMVKGGGRYHRNSTQNMFWRDSGIDPRDFNWARWREAMNYKGNTE
jgi:hypothetical protein